MTRRTADRVVAVIGAGMSGLTCGRTLADHGHRVHVFDKSRGPGGRMSTRRAGELRFDHGAQYFTARDPRFKRLVESWRESGLIAPWTGSVAVVDRGRVELTEDGTERYVGVPGMNAVCRHLAGDLNVSYGVRIVGVERDSGRWFLHTGDGDVGGFDAVVLSAPAPQTAALLAEAAPDLAGVAAAVEMAPCWAAMVGFPEPLGLPFDGAFIQNSPLSWVARNGSKPGRPERETWVLHGSPQWSVEQLELDSDLAARRLIDAFHESIDRDLPNPDHVVGHRWRFALPVEPLAEPCLFDRDLAVAACGDWCGGPRVEGAFLSGSAAAGRLLAL